MDKQKIKDDVLHAYRHGYKPGVTSSGTCRYRIDTDKGSMHRCAIGIMMTAAGVPEDSLAWRCFGGAHALLDPDDTEGGLSEDEKKLLVDRYGELDEYELTLLQNIHDQVFGRDSWEHPDQLMDKFEQRVTRWVKKA